MSRFISFSFDETTSLDATTSLGCVTSLDAAMLCVTCELTDVSDKSPGDLSTVQETRVMQIKIAAKTILFFIYPYHYSYC